jgi:DNA polymerase-3 subunit epsilon/CBS domain-containing protein
MALLSPSTPLISLPAAAIDTETTGLDPHQARIVQIAAIRIDGENIDPERTYQTLVNPGVLIPGNSSAIHGIFDKDVSDAPVFVEAWDRFNGLTGPRILIGYRTGFDVSVFKRECQLAEIDWPDRHWICVQVLSRLVAPQNMAVDSLESLADWLGVTIADRHTALGDAKAAAGIWVALIPLLRQKGIRTLGEALSASGNLLNDGSKEMARFAAGIEADVSALEPQYPIIRIDSYAYRRRLADVMSAPPVFAPAATRLKDAAKFIIEKRVSSMLVEDDGRIGIVTERDLLRGIAAEEPAGEASTLGGIMSHPLHTLPAGTHLYRAIGRMNRLNIRHLAVTDGEGRIVGVVTPRNLLRARANEAIILGDEIESVLDGAGLAAARAKLATLAQGLVEDGLDAHGVCAVISAELCNLTRRAAEIGEQRMEASGMGKPPVPYAVMVLGSGGRGESLLVPDQDNAIVYARGEPDGPEDRWFAKLGTHIADLLDEAGVPYCQGGVMAKNPEWRKSVAAWHVTIDEWVRRSRPQDLLNVDIFFDGVPVHGDKALADEIWRYAYARAHVSPTFQILLAELSRNWTAPIGVLGGFRADKGDRTDLKRGGLMPIFTGARVLSIKYQLLEHSSAERLRAAANADVLSGDQAETLISAHEMILKQILVQQLKDATSGVPLSNLVETGKLSAREKRSLKQAIRDISIMTYIVSEGRI